MLDFVLNQLSAEEESRVFNALNQGNVETGGLLVTFHKNNQHFVNSYGGQDLDFKKVISNFPDSLSRYVIRSFSKCGLP